MRTRLLRCLLVIGFVFAALASRLPAQTASQLYTEATQTYQAGNVDAAKQKLRLALEVDKNFRPAGILLAKIAAEERQTGAAPAGVSNQSLQRVLVSVEFRDTTLQTAIEFLRQRIGERSGGKVEPNFVLRLTPELANKKVTLRLNNVPASEVMRYLGSLSGVDFRVEPYAVSVMPASPAPSPTP